MRAWYRSCGRCRVARRARRAPDYSPSRPAPTRTGPAPDTCVPLRSISGVGNGSDGIKAAAILFDCVAWHPCSAGDNLLSATDGWQSESSSHHLTFS